MRKVSVRVVGGLALVGALLSSVLVTSAETSSASGTVQVLEGSAYGFSQPDGISSDGTNVWVTNPGNNTVSEFSASTGDVVQILSGSQYHFDQPTAIASDGTTRMGCQLNRRLNHRTLGVDRGVGASDQWPVANSQPELYDPDGIVISGGSVWVSNWGPTVVGDVEEGFVTELSASTGALVQEVANPTTVPEPRPPSPPTPAIYG